jgi:hypothetical protein
VPLNYAESEQQSQLATPALQADDSEVRKPARPEEPRTISVGEKAMAASVPASKYRLSYTPVA